MMLLACCDRGILGGNRQEIVPEQAWRDQSRHACFGRGFYEHLFGQMKPVDPNMLDAGSQRC